MSRDLLAELDADDGELPTSWIPKKAGDTISGTLLRYDRGHTAYGEQVIAVLREDGTDEKRGVWLIHTVLRNLFAEQKPLPGERLAIRRDPDSEKGYKRYRLVVDRDAADALPDFDKLAAEGDDNPLAVTQADYTMAAPTQPVGADGPSDDIPF